MGRWRRKKAVLFKVWPKVHWSLWMLQWCFSWSFLQPLSKSVYAMPGLPWFIILLRFHTEMEWMRDSSFRGIKIIRELFQSHLGQPIVKWGYIFSVLLNIAGQYVLFQEEAVELGWFPVHCMFSGICCNKWKISLS